MEAEEDLNINMLRLAQSDLLKKNLINLCFLYYNILLSVRLDVMQRFESTHDAYSLGV